MSELRPEGAVILFDGAERRLIWDYGVIEQVQDIYGGHPFLALQGMFWSKTLSDGKEISHYQARPIIDLMHILLNNEVERDKYFSGTGKSQLKTYTRAQIGFLIDRDNVNDVVKALMDSWTASMPTGDDDGEDGEEEEPKNAVRETR
jgi:hypothetical protein